MSETHAISLLKKKRAEIAGQIDHLYAQLEQARAGLVHIEGALRIFGYEGSVAELPRKKFTTKSLFKRNEASRFIFDQLRAAPTGLITSEIAERFFLSKGWDLRDKELLDRVKHRFGNVLLKHAKRGEVDAGDMEGPARRWHMPKQYATDANQNRIDTA